MLRKSITSISLAWFHEVVYFSYVFLCLSRNAEAFCHGGYNPYESINFISSDTPFSTVSPAIAKTTFTGVHGCPSLNIRCISKIRGGKRLRETIKEDNPLIVREQDGSSSSIKRWNNEKGIFEIIDAHSDAISIDRRIVLKLEATLKFLKHCFIPGDVSFDYFSFTKWRLAQRFVSAIINVLGTKALLLALGIESRSLGAAAVTNWVLKDALGKLFRILWAGKMGRRFDSDAKRWRYRSSLLYATGNGLEIITYIFPQLFLLLAMFANAFKQISMLTSSATRSTIYRSFACGENIGDITAKGEAQIACTDLLGLSIGVALSKALGSSRCSIVFAYVILSTFDIIAIYQEIRSVVFRMMNYERAYLLVRNYKAASETSRKTSFHAPTMSDVRFDEHSSSPLAISRRENIFLSSQMKPSLFTTLTKSGMNPQMISEATNVFCNEMYILSHSSSVGSKIILKFGAQDRDVVKSLIAWVEFKRLREISSGSSDRSKKSGRSKTDVNVEEDNLIDSMIKSRDYAEGELGKFLESLNKLGWRVDKYMFSNISARSEWNSKK